MDTQGEKLLQDLVNQEKSLVAQVEQARNQAKEILATANTEANEVRAKAADRAEEAVRTMIAEAEAEAGTIRAGVVSDAEQVVADLASQTTAKLDDAVNVVLEKVLP